MKFYLVILCVAGILGQKAFAQAVKATADHQQQKKGKGHLNFDKTLLLDARADTTANVSFGDLNGDGHLDILLVKGRHWPIIDRVLLGDGRGGVSRSYSLGNIADRSYTGGLADFNGDGFLDIAISNDTPDRKLIYLNDGKGNFTIGSEFGHPEWPTRNLSIADINNDGLPDLILANRGDSTSNYICLNQGEGKFNGKPIAFARYPATTITPADINKDGFVDLVVPYRDGGQSYVYFGSSDMAYSNTHRIPFGPADATIRAAAVADLNGDGLSDIVTIDENKGVYLYFGEKNNRFSAGISLGDPNATPYALAIADIDRDGKIDIIVGHEKARSMVFFNNGTGRHFKPVSFGDAEGTVYGFAIADLNEDGILDIAAARSEATSVLYFGSWVRN